MTIERNAVNSSSPKCLLFEASDLREEEGGKSDRSVDSICRRQ